MLKNDLQELTESSTETDFRLRQELRDAQEEFERLKASGPSEKGTADAVDVKAVLQRVQQLQQHLATCRNSVQSILEAPDQ